MSEITWCDPISDEVAADDAWRFASEWFAAVRFVLKDGTVVEGQVARHDPNFEYSVETAEGVRGINWDEVTSLQVETSKTLPYPEPEPLRSEDGQPFHNGHCWQHSGDRCEEFGTCSSCGKYWGASIKITQCTCGNSVSLT